MLPELDAKVSESENENESRTRPGPKTTAFVIRARTDAPTTQRKQRSYRLNFNVYTWSV